MQGDCEALFQEDAAAGLTPVGDLAPRQCVLSLTARLVVLFDHAPGLWLDNLALRFAGEEIARPLVDSRPFFEGNPQFLGAGALWLTNVSVVAGGAIAGVDVFGSTLFASGVLLSLVLCRMCHSFAVSLSLPFSFFRSTPFVQAVTSSVLRTG